MNDEIKKNLDGVTVIKNRKNKSKMISLRLFKLIFTAYVILTVVTTAIVLTISVEVEKKRLHKLVTEEVKLDSASLASSMWNIDGELTHKTGIHLQEREAISYVTICNERGGVVFPRTSPEANPVDTLLYDYEFDITTTKKDGTKVFLGVCKIKVNEAVLTRQIKLGSSLIFINSIVILFSLLFILKFFFKKELEAPLAMINQKISEVDLSGRENSGLNIELQHDDEFKELVGAFDTLIDRLSKQYTAITLSAANYKELNEELEAKVLVRTEELERAKVAAETANSAKTSFLANMSHEFRTPLNGILGYAQLLCQKTYDRKKVAEVAEVAHVIRESGDHLLVLINDVLDMSKIESGIVELIPSECNIKRCILDTAKVIQVKADEKGLKLNINIDKDLPELVFIDHKHLRQVVTNLLANAVKYTHEGEVTLNVSTLPNHKTRFEVIDTGVGIPEERTEDIFSPFSQIDSNSYGIEGAGLGLAISSKIVKMMFSELKVESSVGRGSCFSFELELSELVRNGKHLSQKNKNYIGYSGARQNILIVDDKQQNRALLRDILGPLGFNITEADNGQAAIDQFREFKPNLIFMDLHMPVLDGCIATKKIREIESDENLNEGELVKVIALSASVFEHNSADALNAGCDDFMPKPISLDTMFSVLEKHLGVSWLRNTQEPAEPPQDVETINLPSEIKETLHKMIKDGAIQESCSYLTSLFTNDTVDHSTVHELKTMLEDFKLDEVCSILTSE